MNANRIFGSSIAIFERALNLRAAKHKVLAHNVANADTPNYKGFDVEVEKAMQRQPEQVLTVTDPRHLGSVNQSADQVIADAVVEMSSTAMRADGNNVDLEENMAKMAENNLMYNAVAQMTGRQFTFLKNAIKGGR